LPIDKWRITYKANSLFDGREWVAWTRDKELIEGVKSCLKKLKAVGQDKLLKLFKIARCEFLPILGEWSLRPEENDED
jgi:hypothetical protein